MGTASEPLTPQFPKPKICANCRFYKWHYSDYAYCERMEGDGYGKSIKVDEAAIITFGSENGVRLEVGPDFGCLKHEPK